MTEKVWEARGDNLAKSDDDETGEDPLLQSHCGHCLLNHSKGMLLSFYMNKHRDVKSPVSTPALLNSYE
jgi:hypothetical protein